MGDFDLGAMQVAAQRYAANGGDAKAFEQGFRAGWAASLGSPSAANPGTSGSSAAADFAREMQKGAEESARMMKETGLLREDIARTTGSGSSFQSEAEKGAAVARKLMGKD